MHRIHQAPSRRRSAGKLPRSAASSTLWISCALFGALVGSSSLEADQRGVGQRRGLSESRASTTTPGPPPSIPRRLLPPAGLGSAANVPSGFYRQLDAPAVATGGAILTHGGLVPNVVYVYPHHPLHGLAVAPPQLDTSSTPSRAVNPQEVDYERPARGASGEPIYITRQELEEVRERHAPRPVYIVEGPESAGPPAVPAAPPAAAPPAPTVTAPQLPPVPALPKQASTVNFAIQPADAEVYLDDDHLGSGASLSASSEGLTLGPGVHVLQVTHPDFKTQRLVFGVGSGDPMEVIVDLAADTPQRRSRIR